MKKTLILLAVLSAAVLSVKLLPLAPLEINFSGWAWGVFFVTDILLFIAFLIGTDKLGLMGNGRAYRFLTTVSTWLLVGVSSAITVWLVPDKASIVSPLAGWISLLAIGLGMGTGEWLGDKICDHKPQSDAQPKDDDGQDASGDKK